MAAAAINITTPESAQTDRKKESLNRDQMVQVSRRLDWRFLLPDPTLSQVVYIGPENDDLLKSLDHFSEYLSVLSHGELKIYREGNGRHFDLLIARSPSIDELNKGISLLESGAYIYWEIQRPNAIKSIKKGNIRLKHAGKNIAFLEKMGFTDIEMHWHRPNFWACREIIPLDGSRALDNAFRKGHSNLKGQLKETAGKTLKASGLLPYYVNCFSLVGKKR